MGMEYATYAPKDLNVLTQLKPHRHVPYSMNISLRRVKLNACHALLDTNALPLLEHHNNVFLVAIL